MPTGVLVARCRSLTQCSDVVRSGWRRPSRNGSPQAPDQQLSIGTGPSSSACRIYHVREYSYVVRECPSYGIQRVRAILLGYQCYVDISTCGYVDIHEVKSVLSHTQVRLFVNLQPCSAQKGKHLNTAQLALVEIIMTNLKQTLLWFPHHGKRYGLYDLSNR